MAINLKGFIKRVNNGINNTYNNLPIRALPGTTRNKRANMIDKVAEQKVRQQPNYSSSLPMEMKQKMKMDTASGLKKKMKARGVY